MSKIESDLSILPITITQLHFIPNNRWIMIVLNFAIDRDKCSLDNKVHLIVWLFRYVGRAERAEDRRL